jgi:hypothetical protein
VAAKKKSRLNAPGVRRVECVPLLERRQHRRSKHQDVTGRVLQELKTLGEGEAIKIRLLGIPAKTLRSAVFRAALNQDLEISSFSDSDHLFILKKPPAPPPRDSG